MKKWNDIRSADELWEAARPHFPTVPDNEQRTGIVLLRELARGEPVTAAHLARALGSSVETAATFAKHSTLNPFIYAGEGGRIQGFWGLSVTPTHHQLMVNGRKLWAWCAPDTLEHPALLGETAEVESRDPETGLLIRLTVSPDGIESIEPTGAVGSIRRPEQWNATSSASIIASACHFHFFFASSESGQRWVTKHPETFVLPVEEIYAFIKRINRHMFGAELARLRAKAA